MKLEAFRSLLRKIGKDATELSGLTSLESYVRDCKDELIGEYQKAQAEWSKIEESFLKWAGGGGIMAASGIISGHLVPNVASLSAAALNTILQLGIRYLKQQQFRKMNPMSVFIDLSRKDAPGGVTLL